MQASEFTLILVINGKPIGTGFLIHADGFVATCYHVIRNAFGTYSQGAEVQFRTLNQHEGSTLVTNLFDEREDVALLRIVGTIPPDLKPVQLIQSVAGAPNTQFSLSGFGEIRDRGHSYNISSAVGKLVGQTQRDGVNMLQLDSKQILRGMSGGAIYCDSLGGVVGLLSARYTIDPKSQVWLRDTGWAARSEVIAALDESRLKVVEPILSTRESGIHFGAEVTTQSMRLVHAKQHVEQQNIYETHIHVGDLDLKPNWNRPNEDDPKRRYSNAVPRVEFLDQVYNVLNPEEQGVEAVALVGAPGEGKSTVASMFVNKYGQNYPGGVLWVEIGPKFDALQGSQPILDRWASWCYSDDTLSLRQSVKWQQNVFDASAVKSLLSNHGEMLVVFDDVWEADALEAMFDALPAEANLLITTRDREIARDYTEFRVDALQPDEALHLLQQHLPNVPVKLLEEMASQLRYHAQALRLAINPLALKADQQEAVREFLQQIKQGSSRILSKADDDFAYAFNFSYQALDKIARYRLRQLGILAQIDENFSTEMAAALWEIDPAEGQRVLEDFHRRSLVLLTSSENSSSKTSRWSIHALVVETLEKMLRSEGEWAEARDRHIDYVMQLRVDGVANTADMPHMLWVGRTIVEEIEELLGYDPEIIDFSAAATSSLNDDEIQYLKEFAEFVGAALGWLLTRPEARKFTRRWLVAFGMVGSALQDTQITATALFALARWNINDGQLETALSLLEEVQTFCENHPNPQLKGWGLNLMGIVYQFKGNTEGAVNCFEGAVSIASENDLELTANALANLSNLLLSIGESSRASQTLELLLPIIDNLDDFYLKQRVMQQLGMLQVTNQNVDEALNLFETAIEAAKRREEPILVAEIENNIGWAYYVAGDLDKAEEYFCKALAGAEETQYHRLKAILIRNLGAVQYARGDLKGALKHLETAFDIFADYPDKHQSVHAQSLMGEVHFQLGNVDLALDILHNTLPELHYSYNTVSAVHVINTIGTIYQQTGRIEEGLTFFQDTLPIIEDLNYRGAEVTILNWLSILLQDVGNMQQAMYYFDRAKTIIDKIENNEERATALGLFASLYRIFGELKEAYETQKKAVSLWRSLNNVLKLSESLVLLSVLEWQQGDIDAAQHLLDEAKDHLDETAPTQMLGDYYNIQGLIYLQLERIDAAAEKFEQSVQVNKEVKNPLLHISNLNNLAMIDMARGQFDSSEIRIKEAMELADEVDWVPFQAVTRTNLAYIKYLCGETEKSLTHFNEAIKMLDENGLASDAAGQNVDMLRTFVRMIKDQQDTPEESLQILLRVTTWDGVVVILNARKHILLESAIDTVLQQAIRTAEKHNEILFAQVMRLYRRLLDKCREKGLENTLRQERATFVDTTIELWWGYLHRCNRQYKAALTHFNRVLQYDSDNPTALIERGWIYRGLGRYEQALSDFRQIEKLQTSNSLALQGIGVVQFEMGQPDKALSTLTRTLERQDNPYTYQWRATVNQALGDLPAALADLEKAIKLDKRCSDHHYWHSLVYLQLGKLKKAQSGLDYVIEMEMEDPARLVYAYSWRGISHHLQDNKVEASSDWAQAWAALNRAVDPVANWCIPLLYLVEDNDWEQAKESYTKLLTLPFGYSVVLAQIRNLKLLQHIYPHYNSIKTALNWFFGQIDRD